MVMYSNVAQLLSAVSRRGESATKVQLSHWFKKLQQQDARLATSTLCMLTIVSKKFSLYFDQKMKHKLKNSYAKRTYFSDSAELKNIYYNKIKKFLNNDHDTENSKQGYRLSKKNKRINRKRWVFLRKCLGVPIPQLCVIPNWSSNSGCEIVGLTCRSLCILCSASR